MGEHSTSADAPPVAVAPLTSDQTSVLRAFSEGGSRPEACAESDDDWRATDPRMAWLLGAHDPDAVDGVITPAGTLIDLHTGGVVGSDGGPLHGVLTSQLRGGQVTIDVDRPLSSVSLDPKGAFVGVTVLTSPLHVVRIAEDGVTTVVADIPPEVELAGWLTIDVDGAAWLTDVTNFANPRLLTFRAGEWTVVASGSRVNAHLVNPVADSRATPAGETSFTGPDGGSAGKVDLPAIRVPGVEGAALLVGDRAWSAFAAMLPDGRLLCTVRSTEQFVRDIARGGSGD